jgi:hypothetical protein
MFIAFGNFIVNTDHVITISFAKNKVFMQMTNKRTMSFPLDSIDALSKLIDIVVPVPPNFEVMNFDKSCDDHPELWETWVNS